MKEIFDLHFLATLERELRETRKCSFESIPAASEADDKHVTGDGRQKAIVCGATKYGAGYLRGCPIYMGQ